MVVAAVVVAVVVVVAGVVVAVAVVLVLLVVGVVLFDVGVGGGSCGCDGGGGCWQRQFGVVQVIILIVADAVNELVAEGITIATRAGGRG